jgi:hypothetical protein
LRSLCERWGCYAVSQREAETLYVCVFAGDRASLGAWGAFFVASASDGETPQAQVEVAASGTVRLRDPICGRHLFRPWREWPQGCTPFDTSQWREYWRDPALRFSPVPQFYLKGVRTNRERELCYAFARRLRNFWVKQLRVPKRQEERRMQVSAAEEVGYVRPRGAIRTFALPRIQEAVDDALTRAHFGLEELAQALASVIRDPKASNADKIAAVALRAKLTYGFAPTSSKNLNINARADALFEAKVFSNPPPPEAVEGQTRK